MVDKLASHEYFPTDIHLIHITTLRDESDDAAACHFKHKISSVFEVFALNVKDKNFTLEFRPQFLYFNSPPVWRDSLFHVCSRDPQR